MNLATLIVASVSLSIQYFAHKYREDDYQKTLQELEQELAVPRIRTYDFIVIGGGSAGSTVAGRLSEHFSVLLLEAGGSPVPQADVPAYIWPVGIDRDTNYFFDTVPQPNAGQDRGGVITSSFGKMLGGSGSHNDLVHNRGHPRDFDNWARLTGDPSWAFDAVLEYFKKYEDFIGVLFDTGDEDKYGYEGPLQVDTYLPPILPVWLEAGQELGYDIADPNGHQRESFTPYNVMLSGGRRVSSYKGFVKPYEETRANLTVLRYSDVEEILIDESGRAYGVAYSRHGIVQRAHASKEIIVSAGPIRSPLLLMKSGIGPTDVLAEAGIPVKIERPGVGRNLGEHPRAIIGPFYINDTSLVSRLHDGDEAEVERYHQTGEGLLGEMGSGPQALLVSSRAKAAGEGDWPDIQISFHPRMVYGLGPPEQEGQEIFHMLISNGRSMQRGSVRLNGTAWRLGERDDQKLAVIDLQLLNDTSDGEVLLEGIKIGLAIVENTTAFQRAGGRYPAAPHPRCLDHWYRSDAYWRCFIYWTSGNSNHFAGSNSMGRLEDPYAVVDSKLRVIGVEALRVIDSSIMPAVPNANPNAPTLMVAEKGAAEVLLAYGVA